MIVFSRRLTRIAHAFSNRDSHHHHDRYTSTARPREAIQELTRPLPIAGEKPACSLQLVFSPRRIGITLRVLILRVRTVDHDHHRKAQDCCTGCPGTLATAVWRLVPSSDSHARPVALRCGSSLDQSSSAAPPPARVTSALTYGRAKHPTTPSGMHAIARSSPRGMDGPSGLALHLTSACCPL